METSFFYQKQQTTTISKMHGKNYKTKCGYILLSIYSLTFGIRFVRVVVRRIIIIIIIMIGRTTHIRIRHLIRMVGGCGGCRRRSCCCCYR